MLMPHTPPPTSLLALVCMIHLGLLVLRNHRLPRGVFPWAIIPAAMFCAWPWVFSSMQGLALGVAAHAIWFVACERLIPAPRLHAVSSGAPPATTPEAAGQQRREPAAHGRRPAPSGDGGFVPLSVLALVDDSPTVRTFRLSRPDTFRFDAGQFLTLRVQVDGRAQVRCYSVSSAPEATGYLEISVKRQGLVSGTLHATLRQGSQIWVRPPAGRFVYPATDDRPLVLIAGGVGITPLASMARHAVMADPLRPVTLLYSARTAEELVFGNELSWLSKRHPSLRVAFTVTGDPANWHGHRGRVGQAMLARHVPEARHSVFMLCGPGEMVQDVRALLAASGVADAQIRFEVFQAAQAIGARTHVEEAPLAAPTLAAPTLALARSGRTVAVASGETLLDAAERAGAPIPSLCRSGVCGTCRTRLLEGDARCTSDALGPRDREAGYVLPCVTWAHGDCTLEA